MCTLGQIPPDLQNIVCMYAYDCDMRAVQRSLRLYADLKTMRLPFFFYREKIWDWSTRRFLASPMIVFEPIDRWDGIVNELFDQDAMYSFLLGLDFRKRKVRTFGTRERWLHRLSTNWCVVEPFAAYYRMIMRSPENVMKKREHLHGFI